MLLEGKTAVIYGGAGAIGSAVARAFARERARVFLAGRTRTTLDKIAREIPADVAQVDALDEKAVAEHADAVAAKTGRIDIALNAVGIPHVQGTPLAELGLQDYLHPVTAYTRTNFITARAAMRRVEAMLAERARTGTLLKRLPTLSEVAEFAAFAASDRAGAMTGAIANLTCGSLVD
jgi:NAD(P)-dependent dehydrogenase (short-subunit alcohol dehydrogenase family)